MIQAPLRRMRYVGASAPVRKHKSIAPATLATLATRSTRSRRSARSTRSPMRDVTRSASRRNGGRDLFIDPYPITSVEGVMERVTLRDLRTVTKAFTELRAKHGSKHASKISLVHARSTDLAPRTNNHKITGQELDAKCATHSVDHIVTARFIPDPSKCNDPVAASISRRIANHASGMHTLRHAWGFLAIAATDGNTKEVNSSLFAIMDKPQW